MRLASNDSGPDSHRGRLAKVGDVEFPQQAGDVKLDRALTDPELIGDGGIAFADREMREDSEFAGICFPHSTTPAT